MKGDTLLQPVTGWFKGSRPSSKLPECCRCRISFYRLFWFDCAGRGGSLCEDLSIAIGEGLLRKKQDIYATNPSLQCLCSEEPGKVG